ncbi:hypothetical protein [Mesorhizobium sp. A556]
MKAQVARDKAMIDKDQATLVSNQADLARARDLAGKQAGTQQAYDQALATETTLAFLEAHGAGLKPDIA